jgi:Uma2 family endonuclease
LTREEFERRYERTPGIKAELLEGVVYVASPVTEDHGSPHGDLSIWAGHYKVYTPGVILGDNVTVRLPTGSTSQPDVYLRISEAAGGSAKRDDEGYVAGAPELIGEISLSTLPLDRNIKQPLYQKNGVREFILWRVEDRAVDWYALRGAEYEPLPVGQDGIVRSEVFPGLWLDIDAMIRGDMATVLRVLQRGIDLPEHAVFAQKLGQSRPST